MIIFTIPQYDYNVNLMNEGTAIIISKSLTSTFDVYKFHSIIV